MSSDGLLYCPICGKYLHNRVLSLKWDLWTHNTILSLSLLIEVSKRSYERERSCICMLRLYILMWFWFWFFILVVTVVDGILIRRVILYRRQAGIAWFHIILPLWMWVVMYIHVRAYIVILFLPFFHWILELLWSCDICFVFFVFHFFRNFFVTVMGGIFIKGS